MASRRRHANATLPFRRQMRIPLLSEIMGGHGKETGTASNSQESTPGRSRLAVVKQVVTVLQLSVGRSSTEMCPSWENASRSSER